MDLTTLSIDQAGSLLRSKEISVKDLASAYVDRIKETDGDIGAYLEVFGDLDQQAKDSQKMIDQGSLDPLVGIPLAIKDNILIQGRKATAGSKILGDYVASYDATVIKTLKDKGAIFLGRTNMDEFAMGSSTENSAQKVTRNPHDKTRVPGGSSGGSAAAVAGGLAVAALGSDTGGSIRQPASFCGCVGLKPTYGAVSRYGLMAMGSSLDQIGPLTRTVADTETLFYAIEGSDPKDSTTWPAEERKKRRQSVPDKFSIGVPWHLVEAPGVSQSVQDSFKQTVADLEGKGHRLVEITLSSMEYALAAYYVLMPAEVSSNMARFDGMRYGSRVEGQDLTEEYLQSRGQLGREVRARSLVGTFVLSSGYYDAYYNKAYTAKKQLAQEIEQVFTGQGDQPGVDVIITPTAPSPAFKIGEKVDDPLEMYMSDVFTVGANIAGVPAISVPAGRVLEGEADLPVGCQLLAPWLREDLLFRLAGDIYSLK